MQDLQHIRRYLDLDLQRIHCYLDLDLQRIHCYLDLDLQRIHCHLDMDSAKLLAYPLVSSHLGYYNSLLYGLANTDLIKLQCIQNRLARIVAKSPPFTCSVLLLRSLHLMPVNFKILFKINLLTYETLHVKQPVHLHSMLTVSLPADALRSSKGISLSVPRVKTNTGTRAFHFCPVSSEQPPAVCLFSHFSCYLQETSEDTSLSLSLSPLDTSTPDSPLMPWNCFIDFAVEH